MKTQNLAILLTDIAGFTAATARQTRDENAAWLQTHAALLRPVFQAFGGTVRKEMGDAFLVTFPSPTDAVLAGTAVLDRLWGYNQSAPVLMRIRVRVVVNMGEVRVDKTEILGEPVNVAARVEEVADGGDVTLTEAVFLTMNRSEVQMDSMGPHTLPGLPEPVNLYRVKQVVPRPAEGELHASYPYGGVHLQRVTASEQNPTRRLPAGEGGLRESAREGLSGFADAFQRVGGLGLLGRLALLVVLLAGLGGGAKLGWDAWQKKQADPFRTIADRVAAGDVTGASLAWDEADEKKVRPAWRMDYFLGRISAMEGKCDDAMEAYKRAVKVHEAALENVEKDAAARGRATRALEELLNDGALVHDVVSCVDATDGVAARFIRKRLGKAQTLEHFRLVARDPTRPAQVRLAVLSLLSEIGEPDAVPVTKILLEVLAADHPCKQRREAVIRLAERRDSSALEPLRAEQKDSEAGGKRAKANACLLGALGEAIRNIEAAH